MEAQKCVELSDNELNYVNGGMIRMGLMIFEGLVTSAAVLDAANAFSSGFSSQWAARSGG